jgi:hypothetical protein
VRKLLGKSSSALSLIAFAGIVVLVLVFSGPVGSLTLTRAPPQTTLVATRPKLPAPPISEAGGDKRKTGSPHSVGTAPTPPNPSSTSPSSPSDDWSADDIKEERKECTRLLAPIHVEFEPEEPMKHRQCGAPAPIRLRALGEGEMRVEFLPPVTVTCRLAAGLYRWIETSLQPAAREMLGSPITRISGQTYSCRHMYHNPRLPLSEHAKANAIDIRRFATTVRTITIRRDWGPTERRLAEMQKKAAVAAEKMGNAPEIPPSIGEASKKTPESQRGRLLKAVLKSEEALHSEAAAGKTEAAAFLRRVHAGACRVLRTVLGPEANESHRDHLHLDMKARDSRICH